MTDPAQGWVMLALSTFRKSEKAIFTAVQEAKKTKKLLVVYVADINLARYFVGAEYGLSPHVRDTCENHLHHLHEQEGWELVDEIEAKARLEGIEMKAYVQTGRFAGTCLKLAAVERPAMVVTTRSNRPAWVKKLFGAPVDELVEQAGCPVLVI